ncbi:thiamin pyrophosphokinase 1 isoform X2 [Aethina tumida]|nr:thiamin pyrophosphokinase 1 isoform X2 [Aethina tumida]
MCNSYEWNPCEYLLSRNPEVNYAIIILNTPINFGFNTHFIVKMWNQAKIRVTVDGGTKRWLNWLSLNKYELKDILYPDMITGDMDSLPKDVLELFENTNTQIICTPDQDNTDFTKSLIELNDQCIRENIHIDTVFVLADTCGRLDHILGNINTLFKSDNIIKDTSIFQIASNSLTWILRKGEHIIHIPINLRKNQEWCALLPIGSPCEVSTKGLKWNLEGQTLEFNGIVSSSNTYDSTSDVVRIVTNEPLVWSMGIDTLL